MAKRKKAKYHGFYSKAQWRLATFSPTRSCAGTQGRKHTRHRDRGRFVTAVYPRARGRGNDDYCCRQ